MKFWVGMADGADADPEESKPMMNHRILALGLAGLLVLGGTPTLAQQSGLLGGKATDEAKEPYSDYTVQIRNAATGQLVRTEPLSATGLFSITNLELEQRYLVELFNVPDAEVVCTEGPYALTSADMISKADVNIDCGKKALWLLLAAPAIGFVVPRSASR